jgi:hypothetical protein
MLYTCFNCIFIGNCLWTGKLTEVFSLDKLNKEIMYQSREWTVVKDHFKGKGNTL